MKCEITYRRSFNSSHSGMSLLETMIALTILIVSTVGIMSMGMIATGTTENQGHLAARSAEYAQDKIEQLMALNYGDSVTDTTQGLACTPSSTPPCNSGTGLAIGGGTDPSNPVTGYADYLDSSGNVLSSAGGTPSGWFYIRVWQISQASTNLKQIAVTAKVRYLVGAPQGALPQATLTSLKANPF
jgi:type II secretory pathway pseudopilin PulG